MFLLNSLSNITIQFHTMSNQNSPFLHRKKIFKYPPTLPHNNHDKPTKVTSGTSNVAEPENGLVVQKSDHSNSQKFKTGSNFNNRSEKSNDSIIEHEISNCDFDAKKQEKKSAQFVTVQSNRKLEKESDLVGMLGKQLYLAESQLQRMQMILSKAEDRHKEKDQEIDRLKRKVKECEVKFKNQEIVHRKELQKERKQIEDSEYLYKRCLNLEHKIYEMEKFLADYGLVWIGDTDKSREITEVKHSHDYLENCYAQLVANIEQLNMAVGKDEVRVHREKGGSGASFKTSSCMSLKFYKNGLVVQNGYLRPYEDATTTSFIRDILDGYFPSELQRTYPQGVPFKVEDHRTETFPNSGSSFPGQGYRLGKVIPREKGLGINSKLARQGMGSVGSPRCSVAAQRQNSFSLKPTVPPLQTSSAKSTKSKGFSEPPSPDMTKLRSQILASHNNNCSDSHIQSHINAELGLTSSRIEKKREVATKDAEYQISVGDRSSKLKSDIRVGSQHYTSGSKTSYHSSTDRSSMHISPRSRFESTCSDDGRSRLRSASLPGRGVRLRSLSKIRVSPGNTNAMTSKTGDYSKLSAGTKKPRATRSATLERKNAAAPLLHQINKPTGRSGELRLKVRSLNGSVVYLVHLCADDTVARLYQLLDTCMVMTRFKRYQLVVSGYESKRLEEPGLFLREYGILGDSVLHIVNDSAI